MPKIQPYEDSILPQGQLAGRAEGTDFGAQVGGAMQQLAGGLDAVADQFARIEEDQARIRVYKSTSDAYTRLKGEFDEALNSLDPGDPDFVDKLRSVSEGVPERVKEVEQQLADAAKHPVERRMIASRMASISVAMSESAAQETAKVNAAATAHQEEYNAKQDQDAVAADFSNANAEFRARSMEERIGGLKTVNPTVKMQAIERYRHDLALTQTQVWFNTDPENALRLVNPNGAKLTPPKPAPPPVKVGAPVTIEQVWPRLIRQESGGRQSAVSPAGAIGVAQIMPATGPEAAALAGLPWDETKFKTDAAYNTALGKAYLAKQLETFGGDITKALAAYNAGPGRVQEEVAKGGAQWLDSMPNETKVYIRRILAGLTTDRPAETEARPQVEPLTDQDIAQAKPGIWGWQHLTWPEKVKIVRQAEAAAGSRLALDRSQMDKDIQDALAARQDGKPYDMSKFDRGRLVSYYGEVNGGRKFDTLQEADQVGNFVEQMERMPTAQAIKFLEQHMPQGGEGYADKSVLWERAQRAYQNVLTVRNRDFVQWAQGAGLTKPVDFSTPETFGVSIGARISTAKMGVSEYQADAHLLSKAEADQLGDIISRETPARQVDYLKMLRYATVNDDYWYADTLAQVAPKNTMLAFAGATATRQGAVQAGNQFYNGEQVARYILEGAHILQGKDLDDPKKVGRPMAFDDNLFRDQFFRNAPPDLFASADAQFGNVQAENAYQAVKNFVAADLYHRGMVSPDAMRQGLPDSVERATAAVLGGVARINDSVVFRPWGMSEQDFNRRMPLALEAWLVDTGIKGTRLDVPEGFSFRNADDGRYLVYNANGERVIGPNGSAGLAPLDLRKIAPTQAMKAH